MAKLYFSYYYSYFEASRNLSDKDSAIFHKNLFRCQFSDEDTIRLVNETTFDKKSLITAWNVVINQLKKHDRSSKDYRIWRDGVFSRDSNKCTNCGSLEKLEAHHIIRWADSIKDRYEINNGIVLCSKCHKKEHKKDVI